MTTATLTRPTTTLPYDAVDSRDGQPITLDASNFDVNVHDGMVTIANPVSGQHRTFRIRTQAADAKFAPGERLVSLLVGPDREAFDNWVWFGRVEFGRVVCRFQYRTTIHATFARMLSNPAAWAAKGATYQVETACRRCRRPLTAPESISTGLGPICAGR